MYIRQVLYHRIKALAYTLNVIELFVILVSVNIFVIIDWEKILSLLKNFSTRYVYSSSEIFFWVFV